MTKFHGLDFNEFTVIEHPLVSSLEFYSGSSISDWSITLNIYPIWAEDGE